MKKRQNIILFLQLVLSLNFSIFLFSFPIEDGIGKIGKVDFSFALIGLILSLVLAILEIVLDRRHQMSAKAIKMFIYLAGFIYADVSMLNSPDYSVVALTMIFLIFLLMPLTNLMINFIVGMKNANNFNETYLPSFWFSLSSFLLAIFLIVFMQVGAFVLISFVPIWNVWLRFILFFPISIILTGIGLSFVNKKFARAIKKYENDFDFIKYQKVSKSILKSKMNKDTENYVKLFDAYFQFGINLNKGYNYFKTFVQDSPLLPTKPIYEHVYLLYNLYTNNIELFDERIDEIKKQIKEEKNPHKRFALEDYCKSFLIQRQLWVDKKSSDEVNKYFSIRNGTVPLMIYYDAFVLFMNAYLKKEEDKVKEYLKMFEEAKSSLPTFYSLANEYINELLIREKSCGAVVYKKVEDKVFVLLEKMALGHVSIPKGHVEEGETEEQTALREIKEETNLDVDIDTNFRYEIEYNPYFNCIKKVVFFAATPKSEELVPQEEEVSSLKWVEANEAIKELTYKSDKDTIIACLKYINEEDY